MQEKTSYENSKTRRALLPALVIPALVLMGCDGFRGAGVRLDPLPANVSDPCAHPASVIATVNGYTVGDDENRIGRLGDALLECGREKQVAVEAYDAARAVLGPR